VDTLEYVPCIHLLAYMRERYGFAEGLCPAAEDIAARTLALPFFPGIEADDQEYVVDVLKSALP
jgi:perosamine synthetase